MPFYEPSAKWELHRQRDIARASRLSASYLSETECRSLALSCLFDLNADEHTFDLLPRTGLPRLHNDTVLIETKSLATDDDFAWIDGIRITDLLTSWVAQFLQQPIYIVAAERAGYAGCMKCELFHWSLLSIFTADQYSSTSVLVSDSTGQNQMLYHNDLQVLALSCLADASPLLFDQKPRQFWHRHFEQSMRANAVDENHLDLINKAFVPRVKGMCPIT